MRAKSSQIRIKRRRLVAVLLAGLLVVTGTAGWVGLRVVSVRDDLRAAATLLHRMRDELAASDVAAATRTLAELRRHTRAAARGVADPGWRLAARLPGPGRDLAAVAVLASTLDDLVARALPPLVEAAHRVTPEAVMPHDGGIDLAALATMAAPIEAAHAALVEAQRRVEAVPTDDLAPAVHGAVTELKRQLRRATGAADAARRASALLPAMLGADGQRQYLVLFQNLAEVRATGGMAGAFAVVTAAGGRLRMVDQGTASLGLQSFDQPVLPVDPALTALYGDEVARHPAAINLTPHFPTAAAIAREMYRRRSGRTVDGVLATDPVALSYLLAATGAVPLAGAPPLTKDNAVKLLLADAYARFPTQAGQDAFFARAARSTFEALTARPVDPAALAAQLGRAAGERRLLVWSARPEEQRRIAGSVLEGALPTDDFGRPLVGVFLNDGGGSKLGYYLTQSAELTESDCRPDGRRELSLRVALGSTAPPSGLPGGVLSYSGVPDPYIARTLVSLFAPAGWGVRQVTVDGVAARMASGQERSRFVALLTVDVPPGRTRTVTATFLAAAADRPAMNRPTVARPAPRLWTTPMVSPWRTKTLLADSCGK